MTLEFGALDTEISMSIIGKNESLIFLSQEVFGKNEFNSKIVLGGIDLASSTHRSGRVLSFGELNSFFARGRM